MRADQIRASALWPSEDCSSEMCDEVSDKWCPIEDAYLLLNEATGGRATLVYNRPDANVKWLHTVPVEKAHKAFADALINGRTDR